tara:strand:+ start:259 stop:519 length:261 start_codon:yes stop_codon:yes gene_type:complete
MKKQIDLVLRVTDLITEMGCLANGNRDKHACFFQVVATRNTLEVLPGEWLDRSEANDLLQTHDVAITQGSEVSIDQVAHHKARVHK